MTFLVNEQTPGWHLDMWLCTLVTLCIVQCVGIYLCQPETGADGTIGRRTGIFKREEVCVCGCRYEYVGYVHLCVNAFVSMWQVT